MVWFVVVGSRAAVKRRRRRSGTLRVAGLGRPRFVVVILVQLGSSTFGSSAILLLLLLVVAEAVLMAVEVFQRSTPAAFNSQIAVDVRAADWQCGKFSVELLTAAERSNCTARWTPAAVTLIQ